MPVHTNSIGAFTFIDLAGTIDGRQDQVEVFDRPGVGGSGARKTGVRGKPFDLVSVNYVADFDEAAANYTAYLAVVGTIKTVIRNTVDFGSYLVVRVVENTPPKAVVSVVGGLAGGEEVRQEMRWTLLWNADPAP